jgi:hypothetical protein
MRRILSILVLLVLGLEPAIPAAALISGWSGKVDESRLPACCRRNGKHHCAMGSEASQARVAGAADETAISAKDSCPFAPRTLASTSPSVVALLHSATSSTFDASELRAPRGIPTIARMSDRRSQPKRGPPATRTL